LSSTSLDHGHDGPAHAGLSFANEPIFALSTPGLPAAIAVVRVTGASCHQLLDKCIHPQPSRMTARQLRNGKLVDPSSQQIIDEPMIVTFAGPKSFTGEDCVEIHLHGSPFVASKAFEIFRSLGLREARPGEFSQRAFLNGKMDLTAAEGLRDLINAQTADQWQSARQLANGNLRRSIDALRAEIIAASAFLEARIDFPDEGETSALSLEPAIKKAQSVRIQIERLIATYGAGKISQHGLRVALIGPPNAGKSTLLNKLIGRDRAIVSEIPGTTRDYIEEAFIVAGHLIRLVDTAGIRKTGDQIEQVGIQHSIRIANESDLILLLVPADDTDDEATAREIAKELAPSKLRIVRTKMDLAPTSKQQQLPYSARISSHQDLGLDELRQVLIHKFTEFLAVTRESCYITNARHVASLQAALEPLQRFFDLHQQGAYDEILAFELQETQRRLQSIIGTVDTEEILGKIFSEFCVGK
jgi:tRNA modification GTPase